MLGLMYIRNYQVMALVLAIILAGYMISLNFKVYVVTSMPDIDVNVPTPSVESSYNIEVTPDHRKSNFIQNPKTNVVWNYDNHTTCILGTAQPMQISGSSMNPTLFDGNIIIVKPFYGNKAELAQGMIITFEQGNDLVTHRIWGTYPDYLMTMGDNNNEYETIDYEDVKYIVLGSLYAYKE